MDVLFRDFQQAKSLMSGPKLAETICPVPPPHYLNRLEAIYHSSHPGSAARDIGYKLTKSYTAPIKLPSPEIDVWTEIYSAYYKACGEILTTHTDPGRADWGRVYELWKELSNVVIRGYTNNVLEAWTLPVLYMAGTNLRVFAIKADETAQKHGSGVDVDMGGMGDDIAGDGYGKNVKLEDAARVINRMFTICISDRAPIEESRKWGLYYTTNLLFKTYFKLNSISLCKNILRALSASTTDMPELDAFPKSHVVTFQYYVGVIRFLEEDYDAALESLTTAYNTTHHSCIRNTERILTYLIPTRLLTSHLLPSASVLRKYPTLQSLFNPLFHAIRAGNLHAFDEALAQGEAWFVKRRIYLTLERGRDICMRNLLRKIYVLGGIQDEATGERRTRAKVDEFIAGVNLSEGREMERDEVECFIANTIYKKLMKGYIARASSMVVLSKQNTFPGTGI